MIPIRVNLKVEQDQTVFPLQVESNNVPINISIATPIQMIHADTYQGEYVVTPLANDQVVLETKDKAMLDDVTVLKVPRFQTSNEYGTTFYIAEV